MSLWQLVNGDAWFEVKARAPEGHLYAIDCDFRTDVGELVPVEPDATITLGGGVRWGPLSRLPDGRYAVVRIGGDGEDSTP